MMDESVMIQTYNPSSSQIAFAYVILILIPFISFIILQIFIMVRFIR